MKDELIIFYHKTVEHRFVNVQSTSKPIDGSQNHKLDSTYFMNRLKKQH